MTEPTGRDRTTTGREVPAGEARDPRTGEREGYIEPETHEGGHGTSVAAWTATGTIMLGGLVVTIFMIFWSLTGIVVGAVLMVLGALAGPVLARAGYGEKTPNREFTGGPRAVR